MRFLKAFILAAGLSAAMSAPALALDVMVVNYERVLTETDAGRSLNTQLQGIATSVQNELRPEGQAIDTEQNAIRTAIGNRTPQQIQADSALTRRIEALQTRGEAFRQRQITAGRDLEYTRQQALENFSNQVTPVVRDVMNSRNASVTIDASVANPVAPAADATADVISRVNQRVRNITVTRQRAPAPQQQGGGQH
jgi:Skp family chaperone for outer membrane proteins